MSESLALGGQHVRLTGPLLITAALTNFISPPVAVVAAPSAFKIPAYTYQMIIQGKLVYGSGGTNITSYVQTSFDGGETWGDIAAMQWTTASAVKWMTVLSGLSVLTPTTPGDAALAANTAISGFIGDRVRVKTTTTGTYAGNTLLTIDIVAKSTVLLA